MIAPDRGEKSTPPYVYGAYGSNMNPTRFDKYIAGSDGGEHGAHAGSRDKTPTKVVGLHTIAAQLYFAGQSKRWGAATAYLSFVEPEAKAYLQTYRVSHQQMIDLARQEAGVSNETHVGIPGRGETIEFAPTSRYGCLVTTSSGVSVLSTGQNLPPGIPSEPYLSTMTQGLVAAGISPGEVVEYLDAAGGRLGGPQRSTYQSLVRKVVNKQP